jgi:hypothetical protein
MSCIPDIIMNGTESPIDELLLDFMLTLKREDIPKFGPDFYSKLMKLQIERNTENFIEVMRKNDIEVKSVKKKTIKILHRKTVNVLKKIE